MMVRLLGFFNSHLTAKETTGCLFADKQTKKSEKRDGNSRWQSDCKILSALNRVFTSVAHARARFTYCMSIVTTSDPVADWPSPSKCVTTIDTIFPIIPIVAVFNYSNSDVFDAQCCGQGNSLWLWDRAVTEERLSFVMIGWWFG